MSPTQIERGIAALYADPDIRGELMDDEAEALFRWGEDQVNRLAALGLDDEQFEAALEHLLKLVRRINRFTGLRVEWGPDEQQAGLDKIAESAAALAASAPSAQAAAPPVFDQFLEQQAALDNIAAIQALTALIAPAAPVAQSEPPQPAPVYPLAAPPTAQPEEDAHDQEIGIESGLAVEDEAQDDASADEHNPASD